MPESFSIDSQPYFFLKKRFIIIFWCVYMCICVWACACVLRGQMSWINWNGIYSQFEPCDVGSGNRTQVLWKSSIFAFSHWAVSPAPLPYLFYFFMIDHSLNLEHPAKLADCGFPESDCLPLTLNPGVWDMSGHDWLLCGLWKSELLSPHAYTENTFPTDSSP